MRNIFSGIFIIFIVRNLIRNEVSQAAKSRLLSVRGIITGNVRSSFHN